MKGRIGIWIQIARIIYYLWQELSRESNTVTLCDMYQPIIGFHCRPQNSLFLCSSVQNLGLKTFVDKFKLFFFQSVILNQKFPMCLSYLPDWKLRNLHLQRYNFEFVLFQLQLFAEKVHILSTFLQNKSLFMCTNFHIWS